MSMDGMKKEIGPALATAGGAAMLATGNPAGAALLGTGISGLASGMMPQQKQVQGSASGAGAATGASGGMAPAGASTSPQIQAAGMTQGGPQGSMFAGKPVQSPDPGTSQPGKFTPPMDPALRKLLTGM